MAASTALYRNKANLQSVLKELPAAPGIYRFYDVNGALIYVGKSVCLRDRVRSYFSGKADTKKLRRLRQEIARLDWEQTGSELEALLLESRLVKRHHPRFNVMLRSFVPLPYVRVDRRDPFPKLEVTRTPARDGAAYFGPFHNHGALEAAVEGLTDALGLRNCDPPGARIETIRPCYRYELGSCSAPCLGLVTPAAYAEAVDRACDMFGGANESALQVLQSRMERAAERLQFEFAARLRDAMRHIRAVVGRQQALTSAVDELSLVAACPSRHADSVCLFVLCSGRLVLQEDVPAAAFRLARSRKALARRLVAAAQKSAPGAATELHAMDSALLDEIQIVTTWMKQKTRNGAYWLVPDDLPPAGRVAELEAWLKALAAPEAAQLAA